MSVTPWWERLPERFLREHDALASCTANPDGYITSFRWRIEGETLVLTVNLRAWKLNGIEIRFPTSYPEGCPDVRPSPYVSLSEHQYVKTGTLCLELGPDNWHSELLAIDLVLSAARLELAELVRIVEGVPVPNRHTEPPWHRARASSGHALVLTREASAAAKAVAAPTGASFAQLLTAPGLSQFWLRAAPLGASVADLPPAVAQGLTRPIDGWLIPDYAPADTIPRTSEDLLPWLAAKGAGVAESSLIYFPNAAPTTAVRITKDAVDELYVIEVPERDPRAPTWLESLAGKRIGIVGLGSLGSKIAIALARAGAPAFTIVDGDLLLPENISRHSGELHHIGMLKTHAVENLINAVAFGPVDVKRWPFEVGGALPPELHAEMLDALASCDLLIDATADPHAHAVLAALASDHQRPLVWSEVWAGGVGGLLAWAMPGRTPCPRCVRRAYLSECSAFPEAPFRDTDTRYAAGDDEPVVATDADVGLIAAATARASVDIATGRVADTDPVVLFGFECTWIFTRPFETRSIRCWTDDWNCPRCWTAPSAPSEAAAARVKTLLV